MLNFDTPWLEKGDLLVCFGDSITANQNGYVKLLADKLKKHKIKFINAGLGGDKTPAALTRLQKDVIALKPSAVSIALGTNDCAVGRYQWADEPTIPAEAYKANLIWIVHICRLAGIKKFSIATPAHNFEGPAFREQGRIMEKYCLMAREAADEAEARLVPLDAAFETAKLNKKPDAKGLILTTDGTHMTPEGNELIAKTMLDAWKIK